MLKLHLLRLGSMIAALFMINCANHYAGKNWLTSRDPTALACKRECLGIRNACDGGVKYTTINGQLIPIRNKDCGNQYDECMATCPNTCDPGNAKYCMTPEGENLTTQTQ